VFNAKKDIDKTPSSIDDEPANVLTKIAFLAELNPKWTEYVITDASLADELLLALAALFSTIVQSNDLGKDQRGAMRRYGQEYRKAVLQGKSLQYIHELPADELIELAGLTIRAELPTLQ
jgi:hypothetical protein